MFKGLLIKYRSLENCVPETDQQTRGMEMEGESLSELGEILKKNFNDL